MAASNGLVPLFEHNHWANATLFELCEGLDDVVLDASVNGCFGTIRETLRHIARAEALYVGILTSPRPDEGRSKWLEQFPNDTSKEFVKSTGEALIRCAHEIPADSILEGVRDDGYEYRYPASSMFLQAINHATEHRTQIATILTQKGIQPPDLDGWVYLYDVLLPQGTSE
jgi:uncharacterized damage-inducible protein DinB